mgnify:CR=1 FL=1
MRVAIPRNAPTEQSHIEVLLELSAERLASPKQRGKSGENSWWHGKQGGVVKLCDRKLSVSRPRVRRKGGGEGGEGAIPAYEAMQNYDVGKRMLGILLSGVSTRKYRRALPALVT